MIFAGYNCGTRLGAGGESLVFIAAQNIAFIVRKFYEEVIATVYIPLAA